MIALCGGLGAGKTTLTKGIAKGLGVRDAREIRSPTFTLIHERRGRRPLLHADLYRLTDAAQVQDLGWEELLGQGHVLVVEWAQKFPAIIPRDHLRVALTPRGVERRALRLTAHGRAAQQLLAAFQQQRRRAA